MKKTSRLGLILTPTEKSWVRSLAELEGGLTQAALIRRLIREAARKGGILVPIIQEGLPDVTNVGGHDGSHN